MKIIFNLQDNYFMKDPKTFIHKCKDGTEQELSIYKLNRMVSLIANKYLYNQDEHAEFVEISSGKLNDIDTNYTSYIDWLISNWIIIKDDHYVVSDEEKGIKGSCKSYAFHDEFKNWGRVIRMEKEKFDENTNKDQSTLIAINPTVIRNIRRDFKAIQINNLPIEKDYKIDNDTLSIIDFKSYLSSEINYWRMKNNDSFYNWKSGRLYTNFCQCSKSTRLNNYYFDDKLTNLDIPSSFPLWLAVWLKDHGMDTENYEYREFCTMVKPRVDKNGNFIKDENNEIKTGFYKDLRSKMDNNRNLNLSKIVNKPITTCQLTIEKETAWDRDGFPIEFEKLKCGEALEDGGFCPTHGYFDWNVQTEETTITKCQRIEEKESAWDKNGFPIEYKKKKCNRNLEEGGWCPLHGVTIEDDNTKKNQSEKPHISKDKAKADFQKWLNGDNDRPTLINYIFQNYYGDIQSIVDMHKNGDKKYMYYQLVAMETHFIFNIICGRLYAEIPSIKILTCHDQIYFEQRFFDQVEAIWIEELNKFYDQLPAHEQWDMDYQEMRIYEG